MLQQNEYDIVFMDLRMPEMSGFDTAEKIREMGIATPIIALTASAVVGVKDSILEAGMNDYLWKPIIKTEFIAILKKWLPEEKIFEQTISSSAICVADSERHREFWDEIKKIEELSVSIGLDRVDGQRDVYEKTLKLAIFEINKSSKNLPEFLAANDMENFHIEAHGIKGAFANIGAMDLSGKAHDLEIASEKPDIDYCKSTLPDFLKQINSLAAKLEYAFDLLKQYDGQMDIPPELPPILQRLMVAFDEIDLVSIDSEIEKLDMLDVNDAVRDVIEQIKDAVVMMDYDVATEHIQWLISG